MTVLLSAVWCAGSTKQDISYNSNGARIVTVGDVDADGDVDAIAASYYDNTIRWFENDGTGKFTTTHIITTTAVNAQGVVAADLDGDGLLDSFSRASTCTPPRTDAAALLFAAHCCSLSIAAPPTAPTARR